MSSSPTETTSQATGTVEIVMPQMGISVSEGTILEWRKQPGDQVAADETICDVTTDKVDVEIPCPASGELSRILVEAGETVAVGTPIAEISTGRAPTAAPADDAPAEGAETAVEPEGDRAGFVSPVVRRIADRHGIDLAVVEGTGIGGRIRKKDLLAFIEAPAVERNERPLHTESPYVQDPSPANGANGHPPAAAERRVPMTPMRRAIAEHMVRSRHTAAHATTIVEVDFSAVARRRAELRESFERRGVALTYLAFVARATVEALEEFPVVNSSVEGDELVMHDDVNLGIAVALDQGLIVPVVKQAQRLSLEGLAAAIGDVAARARDRRLDPDEVHGGTFTITNPGQFGAVLATPIINQPQVAILDLEAIVKRPVVVPGPDGADAIAIRPMAYLPLSWDHRAMDGAEAARFLGSVKARLEGGLA